MHFLKIVVRVELKKNNYQWQPCTSFGKKIYACIVQYQYFHFFLFLQRVGLFGVGEIESSSRRRSLAALAVVHQLGFIRTSLNSTMLFGHMLRRFTISPKLHRLFPISLNTSVQFKKSGIFFQFFKHLIILFERILSN